jgi:N-acetyl sugar amidotransferase
MDTTDPEITFDEDGICNHCRKYDERAKNELYYNMPDSKERLGRLVQKIKKDGEGKEYDCIIGVSGGRDSTTVAHIIKKLGLRPLAVHVDNGWDAELAVSNIEKTLKNLEIELYTRVLDWEEFKDLQISFLKASVANCEIPTDHAIVATLYRMAAQKKIKYILSGGNLVTEGIIPESWGYDAKDLKHIKAIHKKFGKTSLKNFPTLSFLDWFNYVILRGIKFIPILNYVKYDKKESRQILEKEIGWRDYGIKHGESIYTRFFQNYILFRKFHFDKRRAHLSTLVCSGQMTRDEALKEINIPPYQTEKEMREDKEYVTKKLGVTEKEFDGIMALPVKTYKDYPNNHFLFNELNFIVKLIKRMATRNY